MLLPDPCELVVHDPEIISTLPFTILQFSSVKPLGMALKLTVS